MADETSSCRPARLIRFETTVDGTCDGLLRRVGDLEDALATYRSSCGLEYRAPTADTDNVVREFTRGLRDLGRWTGDVGRAFIAVDIVDAYMDMRGFDEESVITVPDDVIADHRHLEDWDDPFRGVADGEAEALADSLGQDYTQDGPPSWLQHLEDGGTAADIAAGLLEGTAKALADLPPYVKITLRVEHGTVIVMRNGTVIARWVEAELSATLRTPAAAASGLASTAKWIGRAGTVLAGAAGFLEQWFGDEGMPTDERVVRATTRGVGAAGGGVLGGLLAGAAAGTVCGPGAPVCSTILGISGAILGGLGGSWLSGLLPWMDEPEPPKPGERDRDEIEDIIAGIDNPIDPGLAASVDLMASDIARRRVADDPFKAGQVERLLPDREELENVIQYGTPNPPSPSPPTGTTTTTSPPTTVPTAPPSPSPGPAPSPSPGPSPSPPTGTTTTLPRTVAPGVLVDPWVTGHPWE
jgi:hypothetical protein